MSIQRLLIIFITLSWAGQSLAQRKESYDRQACEFLNATRNLKELVLLDEPSIIRPSCLLELDADTFYTKKEILLIEKMFKNPPIKSGQSNCSPTQGYLPLPSSKPGSRKDTKTTTPMVYRYF